tara:strand:+ start:202 stop:306 length:105 start_codon:yes stop_codon:yes gene_type:complete
MANSLKLLKKDFHIDYYQSFKGDSFKGFAMVEWV